MKRITIKRMVISYFRGIKSLTIDFNPNGETRISGDNGTGKSTIRNAFLWCAFGKDAEGRTDYEIFHKGSDGEPLKKVDASVTLLLDVDGVEYKFTRTLRQKWVKPNGHTEEVYKGNETITSVNDVPMKVGEYSKAVDDIIPEDTFRLLTTPEFFPTLPWKEQRSVLMSIVGGIEDEEIAGDNTDFLALVGKLKGKDLDGYRKELAAARNKATEELKTIQPRIDQIMQMDAELQAPDSDRNLAEELNAIEEKIKAKEEEIKTAGLHTNDEKQKRITELEDCIAKKKEAVAAIEDDVHRRNREARNEAQKRIDVASESLRKANKAKRAIKMRIDEETCKITRANNHISSLLDEKNSLAEEWKKCHSSSYTQGVCSLCGQPLPADRQARAEEEFNAHKASELKRIEKRGADINQDLKSLDELTDEYSASVAKAKEELQEAEAFEKEQIAAVQAIQNEGVALVDMPIDVAEIRGEIKTLREEIETIRKEEAEQVSSVVERIEEERNSLRREREQLKELEYKSKTKDTYKRQIQALEERGRAIAQSIADTERTEQVVLEFVKAKITALESRVNGLFSTLRFKLFNYTIDGNPSETCIPLIDGKPYGVANTAAQINAGLECINILSETKGVTAPIFIDNKERVNRLVPTKAQLITLKVTEDEELIINN